MRVSTDQGLNKSERSTDQAHVGSSIRSLRSCGQESFLDFHRRHGRTPAQTGVRLCAIQSIMDKDCFVDLTAWITTAGLEGQTETSVLTGFCERASALGLPLARGNVVIDTLHP